MCLARKLGCQADPESACAASEPWVRSNVQISPTALSLGDLVRRIVESTVLERGVRIEVAIPDDEPGLRADERYLEAALSNLVQNAVKFSRDDGVVTVRVAHDATHARVEVEDECGGLPEGAAEDLFAPFTQRGADRRGMGLGLGIARRAAEIHRGSIGARDLPGKGCVFRIELPIDRERSQGGAVVSSQAPSAAR